MFGYVATRDDGINVEVVRCYESEWNIFLTRPNSDPNAPRVVARSVEEYRACKDGYVSKADAMRIARTLL